MGLETDWNCCIIMSDEKHPPLHRRENYRSQYVEAHNTNARLPVGPVKIRQLVQDVDDVRINCSRFAESTPTSLLFEPSPSPAFATSPLSLDHYQLYMRLPSNHRLIGSSNASSRLQRVFHTFSTRSRRRNFPL